jgi:hypothetical protein
MPTRTSDRYVDRKAKGGDRIAAGHEGGSSKPKSVPGETVTGPTGGFRDGLQNRGGAGRETRRETTRGRAISCRGQLRRRSSNTDQETPEGCLNGSAQASGTGPRRVRERSEQVLSLALAPCASEESRTPQDGIRRVSVLGFALVCGVPRAYPPEMQKSAYHVRVAALPRCTLPRLDPRFSGNSGTQASVAQYHVSRSRAGRGPILCIPDVPSPRGRCRMSSRGG